MRQLREHGKHTGGGRRSYGYDRLYQPNTEPRKILREEINPAEAEIVRDMVRRVLGGESMLSVIRDLNARGVTSSTGGRWTLGTVSGMLRSSRIAGLRDDGAGQLVPAPWPAIITEREHAQLVALLTTHARSGQRSARSFLLTGGLVRCGACGAAMVGRPYGGQPTYSCVKDRGGCNRVFVRAAPVEELVAQAVFTRVDSPALGELLERLSSPGQSDEALDAIARQEARLREVEDDYAAGELERGEYRRLRDGARAKLVELRAQVEPAKRSVLEDFRDVPLGTSWPSLSLGRRRAVLDALIVEVRIAAAGKGAAGKFDARRVTIPTWRV